jgi:hypothetical protein
MISKYPFVAHVGHLCNLARRQPIREYSAEKADCVHGHITTESDSVTNTRKADRPHHSRRCSSSTCGLVVGIAFAADPECADVERDAATVMRGSFRLTSALAEARFACARDNTTQCNPSETSGR